MVGSLALVLLGAAASPTSCESLAGFKLEKAIITSAAMVPEGAAPARRGDPPPATAAGREPGKPPPAPATIPAHCRVQLELRPTSDSLINMELWLPLADRWNGKFMGVGNGGFAGSIQGLTSEMPQALRLGYATAGTDTAVST